MYLRSGCMHNVHIVYNVYIEKICSYYTGELGIWKELWDETKIYYLSTPLHINLLLKTKYPTDRDEYKRHNELPLVPKPDEKYCPNLIDGPIFSQFNW